MMPVNFRFASALVLNCSQETVFLSQIKSTATRLVGLLLLEIGSKLLYRHVMSN